MNTKAFTILILLFLIPSRALAASGDHLWNHRQNGDDRFHDCGPWLRPWRTNHDDGVGRWVGEWSYDVPWGGTTTIGSADGSFSRGYGQDHQVHVWTYAYVAEATTISLGSSGGCGTWQFLNYAFDSPNAALNLQSGWNRIDVTTYHQHEGYTFSVGTLPVDAINHDPVDPPVADFTWNPSQGWSDATQFSFTDASSNNPDRWDWDVDNDGSVDYTTQDVSGHTYSAPAGGSATYGTKLEVGLTAFGDLFDDDVTQHDIIEVFGKPVAEFDYTALDLTVDFLDLSLEPGKAELGGYSYGWDMDDDGQYDDASVENPQWMFSVPGTYSVGLRVTNGAGSSFNAHPVTVVPEPCTSSLLAVLALVLLCNRWCVRHSG